MKRYIEVIETSVGGDTGIFRIAARMVEDDEQGNITTGPITNHHYDGLVLAKFGESHARFLDEHVRPRIEAHFEGHKRNCAEFHGLKGKKIEAAK